MTNAVCTPQLKPTKKGLKFFFMNKITYRDNQDLDNLSKKKMNFDN